MTTRFFATAAALALVWTGGAAAADKPAASSAQAPGQRLIDAAQGNDHVQALALIGRDADVKATADDGSTALLWAAHNDDVALAQALIKAGADPKQGNAFGATPMSEAATGGDVALLKTLLEGGADVESPSAEHLTSLMIVARTANLDAAKLLLDHGAKVNTAEDFDHQTALMWAANERQGPMVRLLIAHGADVNARSRVHDNDPRVTAEPRVRYDPSGGMTPLMFAAREGCLDCAKALVEAGARINDYDPDNVTSLILATLNAHFDIAAWLVDAGADVNRWDFWGRTPLWAAVDFNTLPRGGRPDRPSTDDTTPLQLVDLLLAKGANPNALLKFAPPYRDYGSDRGGDQALTTGASILMRAANGGDAESVKRLLAAGARTDLPLARTWKGAMGGITPLMVGAGYGNAVIDTRGRLRTEAQAVETVKLLLDAKADVNARDDAGNTALTGAVLRGWNQMVRTLITAGADPYLANNAGLSPYDMAKGKPPGVRAQVIDVKADTAALIEQLKPHGAVKVASAADAKTKP
ncbi:MAG TPA: ankyrin repeat domain-containing protein [Caulobacteraceae bacterium]